MMRMIIQHLPSFFSHRQYISHVSTSIHARTWEGGERGSGRREYSARTVPVGNGLRRIYPSEVRCSN